MPKEIVYTRFIPANRVNILILILEQSCRYKIYKVKTVKVETEKSSLGLHIPVHLDFKNLEWLRDIFQPNWLQFGDSLTIGTACFKICRSYLMFFFINFQIGNFFFFENSLSLFHTT